MGATEGFWRAEIWSHNMGTDLAAKDCVLGDHSEVEMDCREVGIDRFGAIGEEQCLRLRAAAANHKRPWQAMSGVPSADCPPLQDYLHGVRVSSQLSRQLKLLSIESSRHVGQR